MAKAEIGMKAKQNQSMLVVLKMNDWVKSGRRDRSVIGKRERRLTSYFHRCRLKEDKFQVL